MGSNSERRTGVAAQSHAPRLPAQSAFVQARAQFPWLGIAVLGFALMLAQFAYAKDDLPTGQRSSATRPASAPHSETAGGQKRAYFAHEQASRDARHIADWVVDSGDNRGMPFVVIDKINAKIFVFDAGGRIRGAAPALLGLARGDHTVPGIGERELSDMLPHERTTPAGRFVAESGHNYRGEDIVWVDYKAAVSLHRVLTTKPEERRLQRLASATPADNRISYGCINVPANFFDTVVAPAFAGTQGIVYVLPEIRPVRELFGSYDVEERARKLASAAPVREAQVADSAAGN